MWSHDGCWSGRKEGVEEGGKDTQESTKEIEEHEGRRRQNIQPCVEEQQR